MQGGGRLGLENTGPHPVPYRLGQCPFHVLLLVEKQANRPAMLVLLIGLALPGGAVTVDQKVADLGSTVLGLSKACLRRNLALSIVWGSQLRVVWPSRVSLLSILDMGAWVMRNLPLVSVVSKGDRLRRL